MNQTAKVGEQCLEGGFNHGLTSEARVLLTPRVNVNPLQSNSRAHLHSRIESLATPPPREMLCVLHPPPNLRAKMLRPIHFNRNLTRRTIKICNKPPKRTLPPNSRFMIPQQFKPQPCLCLSHLTPHLPRERNQGAIVGFHDGIYCKKHPAA
jgi:hypothetical protein